MPIHGAGQAFINGVRSRYGWILPKVVALNNSFSRFRILVDFAMLACLSIGTLFATAAIALTPRHPERGVAVLYAPWTTAEDALARTVEAGARFVRFGGPTFIAIAVPDDRGYTARALAAGAWLVVDPQVVAACLAPFQSAETSR
jgi:hypothetical protein